MSSAGPALPSGADASRRTQASSARRLSRRRPARDPARLMCGQLLVLLQLQCTQHRVRPGLIVRRLPRALKQPDVTLAALVDSGQVALTVDPRDRAIDIASVETEFKYEGYLRRQCAAVERQRRQESRPIPEDFAFHGLPGLSREMVERLSHIRPATLGHASRIPGVTPAAVALLGSYLNRRNPPNE